MSFDEFQAIPIREASSVSHINGMQFVTHPKTFAEPYEMVNQHRTFTNSF